jgi:site-specific DNA recombinase
MATRRRVPKRDFSDLSGLRAALYCRVSQARKCPECGGEGCEACEFSGYLAESGGEEKSTRDQERDGRAWAERSGVVLEHVFKDTGISASQFSTKQRPAFKDLMECVAKDEVDVVWVWAIDRSNRDLRVFADMRDIFTTHQVALVVAGKLYDPNIYDDWMLLGITSQFAERYSHELSRNVRRGQASSAQDGRPHGPATYGYTRTYDKERNQFIRDPKWWDDDGHPIKDSPAAIVRDIFKRIKKGHGLVEIARDLNDHGIRRPKGALPTAKKGWTNVDIKRIALNPAYIGRRVYQADWSRPGEAVKAILPDVKAQWEPLIDEETFWTVHRKLTARKTDEDGNEITQRPAAAKSLLSCLVTCTKCGGNVVAGWTNQPGGRRYQIYCCMHRRCSSIRRAALDDYVEEIMIRWLSDPEVFTELTRVDNSAAASQAQADAEQARSELAQWRHAAERGEITLAGYKAYEKGALARIEAAEQRLREATVPDLLVGRIGPKAEAAWNSASLTVKRQIIATVADIWLRPTGISKGGSKRWYAPDAKHRVEWHWLLGPDGGRSYAPLEPPPTPDSRLLASDARTLAELAANGPLLKTELENRVGKGEGSIDRVLQRLRERGWATSELAPRMKSVRLAEIAARAGVSQATASMAINNQPGPAQSTRTAVLDAVDELGYDGPRDRGRRTSIYTITDAGRQAFNDNGN